MKYLLYADHKTIHCKVSTTEKLIAENARSYHRVSDDLWAFDIWEHKYSSAFMGVSEYFNSVLFDKYLDDNSIFIVHQVDLKHNDYSLPADAIEYLFENNSDPD